MVVFFVNIFVSSFHKNQDLFSRLKTAVGGIIKRKLKRKRKQNRGNFGGGREAAPPKVALPVLFSCSF